MSKFKIATHLMENNSYFKWSNERLAEKFNCTPEKIDTVISFLQPIKEQYLKNLKK